MIPSFPQAPGQRHAGQSPGPAPGGQGIQERVGCRVATLPGAAQNTGSGGEQHELGQVHSTGQLVEVHRGIDLGPYDRAQLLRCQRPRCGVPEHSRGVDYRAERCFHPLEYRGQRGTVSDIARLYPDSRAVPA
jgi:hypothetical protein